MMITRRCIFLCDGISNHSNKKINCLCDHIPNRWTMHVANCAQLRPIDDIVVDIFAIDEFL